MKDKKKKKESVILDILQVLILVMGICYFVISLLNPTNDKLFYILNSFLSLTVTIASMLNSFKSKTFYKVIIMVGIGIMVIINSLYQLSLFKSEEALLPDFTNQEISEILKWAEENNIIIEQTYEYSDNIDEYKIISQNVLVNTPLKDITTIRLVVSMGPNYDKVVIIPNLIGSKLEELIKIKDELKLVNITIKYVKSEEEKDTIIEQTIKGQYPRNTAITFTLSLGNNDFVATKMIDLTNKDLFTTELWLKQNQIKYNITYEFSDTIKKDYVISQSINPDTMVESADTVVNIIISKGKSIIVPNLMNMTSDEVIKWISDNNLRIEFSEKYHTTIPKGKIITVNYKEGDQIESGTQIKIVTSKGQIVFPGFNNLSEFKTWANSYNIQYNETYQANSEKAKGAIISFSVKNGDVIDENDTITVVISSGSPITIPNFYNMSKTEATNKCKSLGLSCSFYDSNYSSVTAGNVISQDVSAGSTVTQGKSVKLGLSKGTAKTFTIKMSSASVNSCIGDSNCTINYLKGLFTSNYPGVTFNYTTQTSSTFVRAGYIHENSPIKDGSNVTQGNTYTVIITK